MKRPAEHSGTFHRRLDGRRAGSAEALGQPFLRLLCSAARPVDALVLVSVPLVLVGVFTLPLEARQALAFSYADPSLVTAYTANFVHLDAWHLLSNLAGYALVVPVVYLLSVLGGTRSRFYVVFTVFLVVFPFVLSGLNLAVARPGYTVGFSGVIMAFLGFLPVALSSYLSTHFEVDSPLDLSAALFFGGLALIAVLSLQSVLTYGLALAALLAAGLHTLPFVSTADLFPADVRAGVHVPGYVELAIAALVLFAGLTAVAFPTDPVVDGTVINLYGHLLGFALGFIVTYATVEIITRDSGRVRGVTG